MFNKTGAVIEIQRFFEDKDEEALNALRQDWANDLADWIKPLPEKKRQPDQLKERLNRYTEAERAREGFDITYKEPDPIWRYAYIRALADLGVNADGRGHTFHAVLQEVAGNDPAKEVRRAAEKTIRELGNLRDGWDYGNHKRHLYNAWWWFRQAHMVSLGKKINRDEALQLRIEEWQEGFSRKAFWERIKKSRERYHRC